jgi:hypothetical protein
VDSSAVVCGARREKSKKSKRVLSASFIGVDYGGELYFECNLRRAKNFVPRILKSFLKNYDCLLFSFLSIRKVDIIIKTSYCVNWEQ